MSESRKIGSVIVRPQIANGRLTGKWVADIPARHSDDGQRCRKLFDKCSEACEFAERLRDFVERRSTAPNAFLTFGELARLWKKAQKKVIRKGKKRQSTQETDEYRLRPLVAYFGRMPIEKITEETVDEYQVERLDLAAANTVQGETAVLRKVLRWGKRNKKIKEVPEFSGVSVEVDDDVEPLSKDEAQRILINLLPRVRPLIRFVAELGCRKAEAFGLTWKHVDLERGTVLFKSTRRRKLKNKPSIRRVYLSDGLREQLAILKAQVKPGLTPIMDQFVFPGRKPDQPLNNVRKALRVAVEKARIKRDGDIMKVTLRSFRKAYASWLEDANTPQSVIQENLGHAPGSVVTRKHYQRGFDATKRASVIEFEVPASVQKADGRWQPKPKSWQSVAMDEKAASASDETTQDSA